MIIKKGKKKKKEEKKLIKTITLERQLIAEINLKIFSYIILKTVYLTSDERAEEAVPRL